MEKLKTNIKWGEIFALAGLNAAVAISWIAYHEYQPVLVESFGLEDLGFFLVLAKALVLITIPPLAGIIGDYIIKKQSNYFILMLVGISVTAMIFMAVASIVNFGPDSGIAPFLPIMILVWLIGMNIFHSPANSLIQLFAPPNKLPLVMGVLVLIADLIYAIEPIVVDLVTEVFGPVTTFVVGGILITVSGFLFAKISSNEVKDKAQISKRNDSKSSLLLLVVIFGLILGIAHGFITEFIPDNFEVLDGSIAKSGSVLASIILGIAAICAIPLSQLSYKIGINKAFKIGTVTAFASMLLILVFGLNTMFIVLALILAIAFSLMSVTAFPLALNNLSFKQITYGAGLFFGFSEIFGGLLEIIYY